jgi:hypothetical protein
MKSLTLKETRAPYYTLTFDTAWLREGPVRVLQGDRTIGVLIPPDEYEKFRAWQEVQQRQVQAQCIPEQFEQEVAAFERMLPELLQKYRDRVVAIHSGQVVEVGDTKAEVSERVRRRLGDAVVYIQRVSEYPRVCRFPYFRVVR